MILTALFPAGIDVAKHVGMNLGKDLGNRVNNGDIRLLEEMVENGFLGWFLHIPSSLCIILFSNKEPTSCW